MTSAPAPESPHPHSAGILVLATIAGGCALYLARDFFIPLALSILFTGLLRPVVRWLEAARLPPPVGATIVLVAFVGALVGAGLALAGPVRGWIGQAPSTLSAATRRLETLRRPMDQISAAAKKMEGGAPAAQPAAPAAPGVAAKVFGTTTGLVATAVEVVLLTFLLLASGDTFLRKLLKVLRLRGEKRAALEIASETEAAVSRYMVATALINAGQALLVGVAMWLLHLSHPLLWATLTFVLEFVPYLGGAIMIVLLAVAGLATFDSLGHAALPPVVYLTITTLQNNLVSPVAYGRGLRLNPVAVLVGVLLWWLLWGVPGAFLAVPILATFKILGEHVPSLAPVSEFLGD
ncbi:MAG TPA: AI-2E family transporter [Gemmatimonadales bacterium]|jgi:predicted PurR-regulated permease PerM|nr:AI-2E family transporter [Gemmatimonadales bacterium]